MKIYDYPPRQFSYGGLARPVFPLGGCFHIRTGGSSTAYDWENMKTTKWMFPKIGGKPPKMDGLKWKTLLKWMIWGYHYFWKHPNQAFTHVTYPLLTFTYPLLPQAKQSTHSRPRQSKRSFNRLTSLRSKSG